MSQREYSCLAPYYDRFMSFLDYEAESVLLCRFIRGIGKKRVLDLGAGSGGHLLWLLQFGTEVTAIDLSTEMVELLRKKVAEKGYEAPVVEGDICALPYRSGEFDFAYCWGDTVHHLDDGEAFFRSVFQALEPGGCLAFTWREAGYFDEMEAIGAFYETHGEDYLLWHTRIIDESHAEMELTAMICEGKDRFARKREIHSLRIWRRDELRQMAEAAGFIWDEDLSEKYFPASAEESAFQYIAVCKKP